MQIKLYELGGKRERENERMCQNEDEKRHESAMFSLGLLCIFVSYGVHLLLY